MHILNLRLKSINGHKIQNLVICSHSMLHDQFVFLDS